MRLNLNPKKFHLELPAAGGKSSGFSAAILVSGGSLFPIS
jgi:hypothetical protein